MLMGKIHQAYSSFQSSEKMGEVNLKISGKNIQYVKSINLNKRVFVSEILSTFSAFCWSRRPLTTLSDCKMEPLNEAFYTEFTSDLT